MEKPDLSQLTKPQLEAMFEAGLEVIDCHRFVASTRDSVVGLLLDPYDGFIEWEHYPENDIYDPKSFSQSYYHSHKVGERGVEHGHFHLFLDEDARPNSLEPLFIPKPDEDGDIETLTHLVGISMDHFSLPTQLFTVNEWVTDEVVFKAEDLIPLLYRFSLEGDNPDQTVNRWLTNMVRLYRPHIEALLIERDCTLGRYKKRLSADQLKDLDYSVYEDEEIEILSSIAINIDDHMAELQGLLA